MTKDGIEGEDAGIYLFT